MSTKHDLAQAAQSNLTSDAPLEVLVYLLREEQMFLCEDVLQ
jgi:hypothetical protein